MLGKSPILMKSTICWKDCLLPVEWSWHLCQKSFDPYMQGFISGISVLFHWSLYALLYASTTLFQLLLFCSRFWNQEAWVLHFCCSFSRLFLAFQGSLKFYMNFRVGFSISANNVTGMRSSNFWPGGWIFGGLFIYCFIKLDM